MSYEWRTPEYFTTLHSGSWKDTRGSQDVPGRPRINWTDIMKRNLIEKHGHHLGRSQETSGWQDRMASTCGPPTGRGMNRTEQQNSIFYFKNTFWSILLFAKYFFEITFWKYFAQWWGMRPHFISTVLSITKHCLLYWSNSEIFLRFSVITQ